MKGGTVYIKFIDGENMFEKFKKKILPRDIKSSKSSVESELQRAYEQKDKPTEDLHKSKIQEQKLLKQLNEDEDEDAYYGLNKGNSLNKFNFNEDDELSGDHQHERESLESILKNISSTWHMSTFENNQERSRNQVFIALASDLEYKKIPIDIKINTIQAIARYRGSIIAVMNNSLVNKDKFTIIGLHDNKMIYDLTIRKKHYQPDSEEIEMNKSPNEIFDQMFQVETLTKEDNFLAQKFIDLFVQQNFIDVHYCLDIEDKIIVNKSGIFMQVHKIKNSTELNHVLAAIFVVLDNMGLYTK